MHFGPYQVHLLCFLPHELASRICLAFFVSGKLRLGAAVAHTENRILPHVIAQAVQFILHLGQKGYAF